MQAGIAGVAPVCELNPPQDPQADVRNRPVPPEACAMRVKARALEGEG